MSELLAPCGIDCSQCDAYIATIKNDLALKQKLAENYLKQFNKVISVEDLDCEGCNQDGKHLGFCSKCSIRACAFEKGYNTCAECIDFPCSNGSFIWVENSKSKATLEGLKKK
jgi:hypothetical protein